MADSNKRHRRRKLKQAVEWSRRKLRPFRENRYKFINQYCGHHYSEDASSHTVPVNMIEMATNIFVRHLAPSEPAALATTRFPQLKPSASLLELAINQLYKEIRFKETLRFLVMDGLFGMAIAKIGLERISEVEIRGFTHDVGQPFCDTIDLDDWVHDMTARRYDEIGFAGNRYRVPLEWAKNNKMFKKHVRENLQPTYKTRYNEEGDTKVETFSQGASGDRDEFQDYVELWDLWMPGDNVVVTQSSDPEGAMSLKEPLREVDWDGPEGGPFKRLGFSDVPNQVMPLPPAALWYDLHNLYNILFRKLGRQSERQKDLLAVPPNAVDDAERAIRSSDGEAIRMDNPGALAEVKYGGIDQTSLAFSVHVQRLFTYLAGNLDVLGGLGPQSDTLGQDQLLAANASKRVVDMQEKTVDFVKDITKDLAWYLWTDPLIELPLTKRIPGVPLDIPVSFTPEQREGDFIDYNIEIDPYSMQHSTPSTRLNTITNLMQQFVIPMAPLLQQQGIVIDFESLLKIYAKYTNMTELEEVLMFFDGELATPSGTQESFKPSTTHRINERRNIPGSSTEGSSQALIQTLLGAGQGDSTASLLRPTA